MQRRAHDGPRRSFRPNRLAPIRLGQPLDRDAGGSSAAFCFNPIGPTDALVLPQKGD
jgi:hypothetical protein